MQVCAGSVAGFELGKSIAPRLGCDGKSLKQLLATATTYGPLTEMGQIQEGTAVLTK